MHYQDCLHTRASTTYSPPGWYVHKFILLKYSFCMHVLERKEVGSNGEHMAHMEMIMYSTSTVRIKVSPTTLGIHLLRTC